MKKQLIPVNIYDTATVEKWLSRMAEEGFILNSFKGRKVVFEDAHCQNIKYRLIPLEDNEEAPSSEMKELFEAEGWKYVTTLQETFFVFSNDAEKPKPAPISKEEEQRIYEALKKKKRNSMLLGVLGFFILFGMQISLNIYFKPDDYILGNNIYQGYTFFFLAIINILSAMREYRAYDIVKRKLESMEIGEEEALPYSPETRWVWAERVVQILALAIMLVPVISVYNGDNEPVSITENDLPFSYVSLEEIETAATDMKYVNDYTYVSSKTSLLAPEQYFVEQAGETFEGTDENEIDEPELDFTYIELKNSELGNIALHSMMRHFDTTQLELEGVDEAWVEKLENRVFIFLLKDDKIIQIKYWGNADILSHLDEYIEILKSPAS